MTGDITEPKNTITPWHRNLLVAGAVFTVLLIAMGGILCVTQSIRNCPDWPGCFGRIIPPAEAGPMLEYTHRLLAGISGLVIVSTAILGMVRVPHLRWISIPPLVAMILLLEVSFFGAQVVLRGLAPGWAAVDVGSALLVVAMMVTASLRALIRVNESSVTGKHGDKAPFYRLSVASLAAVYLVLVSGVLVAGKGSVTGCLGWPIYRLEQFQLDGHFVGNAVRLGLSVVGIGLLVAVLVQAWSRKQEWPEIFHIARWVGLALLLEALMQVLLQALGLLTAVLAAYTVIAAIFWALLVALVVRAYPHEPLRQPA